MAAGDKHVGRRLADETPLSEYEACDFGRWRGRWWGKTPNGHAGDLSGHEVEEHGDGRITVSPSIEVSDGSGVLWHGYLEVGVWREV